MSAPSRGGKNGGLTFGRFVKLFGKIACWLDAIADAFKMANGFLPVKVELPEPDPMRLFVPELLSVSFMTPLRAEVEDEPDSLFLPPVF